MMTAEEVQADIDRQIANSKETEVGEFQYGKRTFKVMKVEGIEMVAYRLVGPKGGVYSLLRNQHNRDRFFAINDTDFKKGTPFKNVWFTDKDRQGNPCPLRVY